MLPQELCDQLQSSPAWISAALEILPQELRDRRPREDEWSATEIIRHVLASDAISSPRVVQILIRPGVPLPAFDERAWADQVARGGTDLIDSVKAFGVRRKELVGTLLSLPDECWDLTGEHEHRGAVSVSQICADLVEHEVTHKDQMAALVATLTSSEADKR